MKKWITSAVLVVSIVCYTGIAFAKVTSISGGKPPVKITKSGSYQLQTNIVITNADTTAILVTADDVTIDLNGFAIIGPNVCTGSGSTLVCNNNGIGIGIDATDKQNIKVYNGTVRGMGNYGILTGLGAIIESVRVLSNGSVGIAVRSGTVSGNIATGNDGNGINVVSNASTISGNTVNGNASTGIYHFGGGTISGNTVTGNGGRGLHLGSIVGYVNNVLNNNTGGDVDGGVNLTPNLCSGALCP